jgi:hypothetical protein
MIKGSDTDPLWYLMTFDLCHGKCYVISDCWCVGRSFSSFAKHTNRPPLLISSTWCF